MLWLPHKHDARIGVLMETPPGETVAQQRARCAEYGKLVAERSADLGHDALKLARHSPHSVEALSHTQKGK